MTGSRDASVATGLHSTAIIDDAARVPDSCSIGAYTVIGPDVHLGERVRIGTHVYIERDTRIGDDCRIWKGAVLGTDAQDLKYLGERTWLEIGARTMIREYATLNRGTAAGGTTMVGADSLIMAYAHVAHDCSLGRHVILANAVQMGGHVEIGDWGIVGGVTGIHQFVRIGSHSMIGGASRVVQDVAPFTLVVGNPCACFGLNRVGLRRRGFSADSVADLRTAYSRLFNSGAPLGRAAEDFDLEDASAEVVELVEFVRASARGVTSPGRAVYVDVEAAAMDLPDTS